MLSAAFFLSQSSVSLFNTAIESRSQYWKANGARINAARNTILLLLIGSISFVFLLFLDILQTIDYAINPCDDFFLHACGGWIKNNPIPSNEPQWNQQLILKARNDQLLKRLLGDDKIRHKYVKVRTTSTDFNWRLDFLDLCL